MKTMSLYKTKNAGSGTLVLVLMILPFMLLFSCQSAGEKEEWMSLFNGENLDGWDIKIAGYELNENFGNTFRVEDGNLVVSYDEYEELNNRFGHIFYHQPFSHFKLRLEYRFFGEQIPGGAGWAYRNNGIMFHSQSAESMEIDQDFPVSVEAQFLGGSGEDERPTGAVCTPGTTIEIDGERKYSHCSPTFKNKTFHGDDWVRFELVVYGDSLVHHIVEGDTVLTYGNLRLEETGLSLGKGYIALQAESHPTAFRNIEILIMDEE
jgi:hypothetical protein